MRRYNSFPSLLAGARETRSRGCSQDGFGRPDAGMILTVGRNGRRAYAETDGAGWASVVSRGTLHSFQHELLCRRQASYGTWSRIARGVWSIKHNYRIVRICGALAGEPPKGGMAPENVTSTIAARSTESIVKRPTKRGFAGKT